MARRKGLPSQEKAQQRLGGNKAAYFAGLFDGEGTITLATDKKSNRIWVTCSITLVNKDPLDELAAIYGGRVFPMKAKSIKHRTYWRWGVYCNQALLFIGDIRPWLYIKAAVADLILEFSHLIGHKGQRIDETRLDRRKNVLFLVREANRRGQTIVP